MDLIKKLEARARELDHRVQRSLPGSYDQQAADDRDLLLEAIKRLSVLEECEEEYLAELRNVYG